MAKWIGMTTAPAIAGRVRSLEGRLLGMSCSVMLPESARLRLLDLGSSFVTALAEQRQPMTSLLIPQPRRPRLARDVLHGRHGALAHERDRHRPGAHAVARDAAGGVGGARLHERDELIPTTIRDLSGASGAPFPRSGSSWREGAWVFRRLLRGRFPRCPSVPS